MALLTWMTRLLRRGVGGANDELPLLSPREFQLAATCERMRVDRNHSVLSILLITLPAKHSEQGDLAFLARLMEGRLRITDTAGILQDGRVGVLLPDTPASGAWKVAEDICEVYEVGDRRPDCEVLEYPDHRDPPSEREEDRKPEVVGSRGGKSFSELFFALEMPIWKRAFDITGASFGLLLTAPLLGVSALTVMLTSKGGAFFTQEREGVGGRRFRMYKLRTMYADAEAKKATLRQHSEQDGPAFKMTNDPRTTYVGRWLRWTSLDELPQLLNVLRGEMSLVGPRPLPVEESRDCAPWQRRRLLVTPGITCTWQVYARNKASFDDWVRMDIEYARKLSFWGDVKLLFLTPFAILFSSGPR